MTNSILRELDPMSNFTIKIPDSLRNKLHDDAREEGVPVAWLARKRLWGTGAPELRADGKKRAPGRKKK